MKLRILKDELNDSIQHVSKAVSSRTTIPILSGIKIEVTDDGVTLTASDTDISIQSYIPQEKDDLQIIEIEQTGSIVVPGKLFIDLIRKLPSEWVDITVKEPFHVTIHSGTSELQMVGLDPEEYPMLPRLEANNQFSIPSEVLKLMVRQTIFAVSMNEGAGVLTGLLWSLQEGKLKFVGTDRHRLSTSEKYIDADPQLTFNNIVISGKNLNELNKLLPDQNMMIDIVVANNQVLFKINNILFYTRILDGTYPDTSKIIPQVFKTELELDTKLFLDAMDRAYLLSREDKSHIVRLVTQEDQVVEVSSSLSELGKITEQVTGKNIVGEPLKISFNARYMLDALKSIESESIHIGFTGAMSPIIIRPVDSEELLHLILPYRTAN